MTNDGSPIEAIKHDPDFHELVRQRTSFGWILSGAMAAIYFGFILLVAFAPKFLGTPIGDGVTTLGIPLGLFVIVSAFVLTGIYVRRANAVFDPLTEKVTSRRN